MSSPRSPLLRANNAGNYENDEQQNYVEVPHGHGFSQSAQRSSFTMDSVGRRGIVDAFSLGGSAPGSAIDSDEEDLEDYDQYDAYTPAEATRLAREQQTLLNDNNIRYKDYGALGGDLTMDHAREEVMGTNKVWDDAVNQGRVRTTIWRELVVLSNNSLPLTLAFLLQFSLPVASIFSTGHLGKTELGAVSLAAMTSNITGFALIQGFATCLDTLCSQAFGAGKFHMVGLHFQKCVALISCCFIPVGLLWTFSEPVLNMIVPDPEIARLASLYLRIVTCAGPGYILFECGKKYMQAQGIFHAGTVVLCICAPFNLTMNYLLVWNEKIGIGYAGAPTAVCMTNLLMPTLLFVYCYFINGWQCWGGLSKNLFKNWGPMFKLAIPGFIMVEAEFLAFEVMTLSASRISTAALAAQSVLATVTSLSYQIPFAISIAIATRVANFIGATLKDPAKLASWLGIYSSYAIATFNGLLLYFLRYKIGGLFSNDDDVIELVAQAMPVCALLQLVDSPACMIGGVLRGQGRQHLAGYLNLFFYYLIALPIGIGLAFGKDWGLVGLWSGIAVGLAGISFGETWFVLKSDWPQIVNEASERDREERIVNHV